MREVIVVIVCLFLVVSTAQTIPSEEITEAFTEHYEQAIQEAVEAGIELEQTLLQDLSAIEPQDASFSCPKMPDSFIQQPATSVHKLSPYHIKVMGAVGDSITAGFGAKAKNLLQMRTEYRGISWSIGGDGDVSTYVTLPNVIKQFNPSVKGFSVLTGKSTTANAHFNQAITGAVSQQIPGETRELVNMIKADKSINIEEDWKLVTIWIGGNDLCAYCKDMEGKSAQNYVKNIKEALNILRTELPRTIVNLVQILDVTKLGQLKTNLFCDLIHAYVCPCVAHKKFWEVTSHASHEYNDALEEMIATSPEFHDTDNFTVVLQPFFKNTGLPTDENGNGDSSYFGVDCFHFTVKGHSEAGRALWNNMMQPVGSKSDKLNWGEKPQFLCPSMDVPFIFTSTNSKSSFDANNNSQDGSGDLLSILLGSGAGLVVLLVLALVVVVAVVVVKRRRQSAPHTLRYTVGVSMETEKTRLIFHE